MRRLIVSWLIVSGLIVSGLIVSGLGWVRRWAKPPVKMRPVGRARDPVDHVLLLDGTMGSLRPDRLTSIGMVYRFLRRSAPRASIYYGKGLQWHRWRDISDVCLGWGVDRQIERAYGWLAMRYRPEDRVYILGYSRGGFAARSLAGMIGRVGLLRPEMAIERNVRRAWHHYAAQTPAAERAGFRHGLCHAQVPVEMLGVFDTVSALGVPLPFLRFWAQARVRFHDHHLGAHVHRGYQALALDETRSILEPLIWDSELNAADRIEQVWFRGCHGDIGGQIGHVTQARPLANIPLVWMLGRAEHCGLKLPEGWREEFPTDPDAPSVGSWRGWGKLFLFRAPRVVGRDPSEHLHDGIALPVRSWRHPMQPILRFPDMPPVVPTVSDGGRDETGGNLEGRHS